jgi:hypothetical protein
LGAFLQGEEGSRLPGKMGGGEFAFAGLENTDDG